MDAYVLAGLVKRLYPGFDLQKFSYRFKLQKFVFLLRAYNLDLGYSFNLYLHGPYSPDLARDAFQVENWEKIPIMRFQSDEQEERFKDFLDFIEPNKDNCDWLEIASTLKLLSDTCAGKKNESTISKCVSLKQKFSREKISKVYQELKSEGVLQ